MSDHAVTFVGLDADDVRRRAAEVRAWLLTTGVAADRAGTLRPGRAWRTVVVPPGHRLEGFAHNAIDVTTERVVHDPGANFEPAACPSCHVPLTAEAYTDLVEPWLTGGEPLVECPACGRTALLGDWDAPWGYAIGTPAVRFNNWPILTDEFEAAVRQRVGGRTAVVRGHW